MSIPMRKDAARSRRAILDAARELFADDATASFAEIAQRAGVGQATVYRHFADRQALLAELAMEDMARLEERVAGPIDAGSLGSLLHALLEDQVRSRGLIDAIRAGEVDRGRVRELTDRCRDLLRPRLEAALAAEEVRPDLTVDDLMVVVSMFGGAVAAGERAKRTAAGARAFEMVIDGLRSRA